MEDDEDGIELCIFLHGSKINDLNLQILVFNCCGQVRGVDSIITRVLSNY